MDPGSNVVLITGGGSGIGLAFAERFHRAGSRVVICGRREETLAAAAERLPGIATRVCDVADPVARVALAEWAARELPELTVLVNNAGIQRRLDLHAPEPWEATHEELAINIDAPIHLAMLFTPQLRRRERAAIVNVTSGLSFAPLADVPVYCATKAALHSFTLSLRHQLRDTSIEVIEVIPPAVDTDLGGPGLHTFGANVDEFADAIFEGLAAGEHEIAFGMAARVSRFSREELDAHVARLNAR